MNNQDKHYGRLVEAFLFASSGPISEQVLNKLLPEGIDLKLILANLKTDYADRGVILVKSGVSWSFRTAHDVSKLLNKEVEKARLPSRAAIEVLSIIAYHQPVTRAEIEEIRGVGLSKGTLDFLFELGWIRPKGRRQTPGRPGTWGTTDDFLDHFNLNSINDLPGIEELKAAGLLEKGSFRSIYGETGDFNFEQENKFDQLNDAELKDEREQTLQEDTFVQNQNTLDEVKLSDKSLESGEEI